MRDISVVICAYSEDRWDELVAAVASLRQQTMPLREIIVVIDYRPGLAARVRRQLTDVIAIENTEAKGASGARNCGVAVAQGTIVAFLDDDAIAEPDWVENLAACYTDPQVVGVGGRIEPRWKGSRPAWFPGEFHWIVGCTYVGMPTETSPVRNVIGANMSVRKQILTTVGGFRASFGNNKGANVAHVGARWFRHHAGDEETELCIRVSQQIAGSVWLYTTDAVVEHQVPAQRGRWSYFLWRCYDEGLGKASLVRMHGVQTGLSAERNYTFKVLPKGVLRGFADALFRCDLNGLARAAAIMLGVTTTTAGYLIGSIHAQLVEAGQSSVGAEGLYLSKPQPLEKQRNKIDLGEAIDRV